jgi:hypothetical protein
VLAFGVTLFYSEGEMVPKTSVSSYNQLTRLIAREYFIKDKSLSLKCHTSLLKTLHWEATHASWSGLPTVPMLHPVAISGSYGGEYEDYCLLGCCVSVVW